MATNKPEAAIIAAAIKNTREARGWTRYKLAHEAGVSERHLAQIENGDYCVRVDILNRLIKALQTSILFPLN